MARLPLVTSLLFSLNLTAQGWVPIVGPMPNAHSAAGITYDDARDVTVLFGGIDSLPAPAPFEFVINETWTFDGTWTQQTPTSSPPARQQPMLCYDSTRQVVVMFGGTTETYQPQSALADTWEWDGLNWTQVATPNAPPARYNGTLTFDPVRNVAVLFGGQDGYISFVGDTWEYDGSNWTQRITATAPSPRHSHDAVYDPVRGGVMMYGGWDDTFPHPNDELWLYDGTDWSQRNFGGPLPPLYWHAMSYDTDRNAILVHGGTSSPSSSPNRDTYELRGPIWYRYRNNEVPDQRISGMSYDPSRNVQVLYAYRQSQVEGATWELQPGRPSAATYGWPCSSGTAYTFDVVNQPALGSTMLLNWYHPTSTFAILVTNFAPTNLPVPGGTGNCRLRVAPPLIPVFTQTMTVISHFPFEIPNDPSLAGIELYLQAAALATNGFALSDAVRAVVN